MRDHLRFAACYWHTMRNGLGDPFGAPTAVMPWDDGTDAVTNCLRRADAFFEFLEKCSIDRFCFHDRDVAPELATLRESNAALDRVAEHLRERMQASGKRLLWGTACLFAHPRYAAGAGTSPDVRVYAHACAQVKHAMEVTHRLGGEGYVFWGGREGYKSLLNTDMKRELSHLAKFLHLAVDYKKQIGFTGQFYIEPKPKEPTKHQYDFDCATVHGFLLANGLEKDLKFNIEANHATLAGHDFCHELTYAAATGTLGSVDANRGDPMLGWDTDQFPNSVVECAQAMLIIMGAGGLTTGGLNFDAHVARESFEPVDLFHAHIGAMDCFARGLKMAAAIRADGQLAQFVKDRYSSYDKGIGADIEAGRVGFAELSKYMLKKGDSAPNASGRVEMLENLFNEFLR
jgi:xylose isomerase